MQGGGQRAERGVLQVRRSERPRARGTHPEDGSPQMGLFSSLLVAEDPAVDLHRLAMDEAGGVRGQEGHHVGDVLRGD